MASASFMYMNGGGIVEMRVEKCVVKSSYPGCVVSIVVVVGQEESPVTSDVSSTLPPLLIRPLVSTSCHSMGSHLQASLG